jgi:hypothetical protein
MTNLHLLEGQTARATTATAINTAVIAGNTAETARNTAETAFNTRLIAESNDRIAYSNEQILLHLLDTKCLAQYGLTSIEIEKEYYKYTDAIVSILKSIKNKKSSVWMLHSEIRQIQNHTYKISIADKFYGFFSPSYKEEISKNMFFAKIKDKEKIELLKEKIELLKVELSDLSHEVQQINELLPAYNEWRTKISRMNIPTYRTYREYRKEYFTGKELSDGAKMILVELS